MTVMVPDKKLFYAPVPKVACTSVKTMLFEVENGFDFTKFTANGRRWHIHHFYHSHLRDSFPEHEIADYRRLTLVRDPIKRFLSAYGNRVIHHDRANADAVKPLARLRKLKPAPDLDEFIDQFARYMRIGDILHHFRPMVDFLGEDASYYHGIYALHQMGEFIEDVSTTLGRPVTVGREQTGGPKLDPSVLTTRQKQKLETFYKSDYQAYSKYF